MKKQENSFVQAAMGEFIKMILVENNNRLNYIREQLDTLLIEMEYDNAINTIDNIEGELIKLRHNFKLIRNR